MGRNWYLDARPPSSVAVLSSALFGSKPPQRRIVYGIPGARMHYMCIQVVREGATGPGSSRVGRAFISRLDAGISRDISAGDLSSERECIDQDVSESMQRAESVMRIQYNKCK